MKSTILYALLLLFLISCSESPSANAPVVHWVDRIMSQYPNYHSNDLSKQAVRDSVNAYANRFISQPATFLEGVKFQFKKLTENGDSVAVFFDAKGCHSMIEYKDGGKESIWTDINIRAVGKVDKQIAASLDGTKEYAISGTVHAWDEQDRFFITNHMLDYIDLGTFILDNIEIKEIAE